MVSKKIRVHFPFLKAILANIIGWYPELMFSISSIFFQKCFSSAVFETSNIPFLKYFLKRLGLIIVHGKLISGGFLRG